MKQIDERGNACPIPVVHTKKALESMDGETKLVVLVDNEPAVQNVTRFAEGKTAKLKVRRSQTMNLRLRSWQRIMHQ